MQRLTREYLGEFGPFFQREATRMADKFDTDAYVKNGVVRWKSNDQVPPDDILELWEHCGKPFDCELSKVYSRDETAQALEAYRQRMANHTYTDEEKAEMRTAFGPGATVVDVITGQPIPL